MIEYPCARCGKLTSRPAGHVNRSRAQGMRLYCGRTCSAVSRRKPISVEQKKAEKCAYDMRYRKKNAAKRRAQKAAYHKATYDPIKAAQKRKARMPYHVEYCRRPEYKAYKQRYDQKRRSAEYGPAAEAYGMLLDLTREIRGRATSYEIKRANGTFGKRQARAREAAAETEKAARHRDRAA